MRSCSISTGHSSLVFCRLDFLSNQVAFPSWFASDTCKGYRYQTTSVSSVEVEQLLRIVSTPPEVIVALLSSCESPLRLNKALLSLKKLGPCARTRTRTAQVVQKASLSLTIYLSAKGWPWLQTEMHLPLKRKVIHNSVVGEPDLWPPHALIDPLLWYERQSIQRGYSF